MLISRCRKNNKKFLVKLMSVVLKYSLLQNLKKIKKNQIILSDNLEKILLVLQGRRECVDYYTSAIFFQQVFSLKSIDHSRYHNINATLISKNLLYCYADYIRLILFYSLLSHYSIIISKLNKLGSILSQNPKKCIRKKQTKMETGNKIVEAQDQYKNI